MLTPPPKGIYMPKQSLPSHKTHNAVIFKVTYEENHEFGDFPQSPESDKAWAIIIHFQLESRIPDVDIPLDDEGQVEKGHEIFMGKRYEVGKLDRISKHEKSNLYKTFFRLVGMTIEKYLDSYGENDPFVVINPKTKQKDIEWDDLVGLPAFVEVEVVTTSRGHLFAKVKDVLQPFDGVDPIKVESPIQWPQRDRGDNDDALSFPTGE